jgi:uncharacterized protein with von Willebrand factor type A (vWA) domain
VSQAAAPTQAPPPLLLEPLEARLAPLARLPRELWLPAVAHSLGALEGRLEGVEALRGLLLAGAGPGPGDGRAWLGAPLAEALAATISGQDLARHCAADEGLTGLLLRSLLWHLDRIVDAVDRGASQAEARADALAAFAADWKERCGLVDELVEVLGDLRVLGKNARWDLLTGVLRSHGWREVVRIRRLLGELPGLARCIRGLGRARPTDETDLSHHADLPVMEPYPALRARTRTTVVPDLPGETRGVRRSARVARMLPAEAMLLTHPRLRLLWHARHAEQALLTYEDDDRLEEQVEVPVPAWRPSPARAPERRLERGPMLVCVDTSGSMQGGAEVVAKAAVLEAVRTAHAQRRACHVFAFSGPGELLELPLTADAEGVERLTRFMAQGFGGGTDVCGPLERALALLDEGRFALADLLIASDGEFGATPEVAAQVARAKEARGLRVQGVLVGDRETIGLLELADDVFWVRDWRRYGGGDGRSPIHSKSLTATYFPGALRGPGPGPP